MRDDLYNKTVIDYINANRKCMTSQSNKACKGSHINKYRSDYNLVLRKIRTTATPGRKLATLPSEEYSIESLRNILQICLGY